MGGSVSVPAAPRADDDENVEGEELSMMGGNISVPAAPGIDGDDDDKDEVRPCEPFVILCDPKVSGLSPLSGFLGISWELPRGTPADVCCISSACSRVGGVRGVKPRAGGTFGGGIS